MYTLFGGLPSVAYTDVFQFAFIVFGLSLSLPFAITNEHVNKELIWSQPLSGKWIGSIQDHQWGEWIDWTVLLILGGVPWQCYFQRVLSSKSGRRAQVLSYIGGSLALLCIVPCVLFGAVAHATDWKATKYGASPAETCNESAIIPLSLQYLTPEWVSFFGLGAISAAVMSSTDSSMLSVASQLSRNVFKAVFFPRASEKQVMVALWVLIAANCALATLLGILYTSVYTLFSLSGDLVYVITLPQFFSVLYLDELSNTYGSVVSFILTLILRILCGEEKLGIPTYISFGKMYSRDPLTGEEQDGPMPFRLFLMLISFTIIVLVSSLAQYLFVTKRTPIDLKYDFFGCFTRLKSGKVVNRNNRFLVEETTESTEDSIFGIQHDSKKEDNQ